MISHDYSCGALYIPITKKSENLRVNAHMVDLKLNNYNIQNVFEGYSNVSTQTCLEERNMNVPPTSTISFTIMPPPPQNIISNSNLNNNIRSRRFDNGRLQGYESDESGLSHNVKGRRTPEVNGFRHRGQKNGYSSHQEQTPNFGKHRNSSNAATSSNLNNQQSDTRNNHSIKSKHYVKKRPNNNNNKQDDPIFRKVHGLMERFTSKAKLFRINPHPDGLIKGNVWDQLSESIWEMFMFQAQKEETYLKKLRLWEKIYLSIQSLQRCGLYLVGSTMTGLGTETSDVDMCLLVKSFISDARISAISTLEMVKNLMEERGFVKHAEVIHAKVPILKFTDSEYGFVVDLNCNNSVGIRNTHLLHCYSRLDWRVRPLIIVVKLWAQVNNINEAKNMTISSYSLVLMVIHYLQSGVKPPVIPCLQGLHPERFANYNDIQFFDIQEEDPLPNFKSDNNLGLGELFIGFLHYYSYFSYARFAISVRAGSRIPIDECRFNRTLKNDPHQWKYLCIEEPFDSTNTARSVYDEEKFKYIQSVFRCSYELLLEHKVLNVILPHVNYIR